MLTFIIFLSNLAFDTYRHSNILSMASAFIFKIYSCMMSHNVYSKSFHENSKYHPYDVTHEYSNYYPWHHLWIIKIPSMASLMNIEDTIHDVTLWIFKSHPCHFINIQEKSMSFHEYSQCHDVHFMNIHNTDDVTYE